MTNVPPIVFDLTVGFVAPSEADVLTGVTADIDAAFGGGLDPSLTTPQGQLATSTTALIGVENDTFVDMTNQFNPAYATGKWQDALAEIYFLQRNPSQPTVVSCVCTGTGVPIPAGSLAKATDGNIYVCTDGGVLPSTGGSITLTFACMTPGPIPCPENTLNTIYRAISGWDSINNPTDGVLGNVTESRSDFEARRKASVALNSRGSLPSVLGAVLDVSGVLDAFVTENVTGSPATIGGVTVVAHSIYVSVSGGTNQAVGNAIWSKKSPGCNYNGNTTVTVVDSSSGYSPPLPSYQVTFERPTSLPILFAVSISNSIQVPSNAVALIQAAIVAAFAGADGGARARIGSTIFASRYYAPVSALGSWASIISILIGSSNSSAASFTGTINGTTLTVSGTVTGTIAIGQTLVDTTGLIIPGTTIVSGSSTTWVVSNTQKVGASFTGTGSGANLTVSAVTGTIMPGQTLTGTGVPANTIVVSQTSGTTGAAGVYVTSNSTTSSGATILAGETISGVVPALNSIAVNLNQVPTINANNISVTLV